MRWRSFVVWVLCWVSPLVMAQDDLTQARLSALSQEVRCLTCPNQTIADSNSQSAQHLKHLIASKLDEGMSDEAIRKALVAEFGPSVLYVPAHHPLANYLYGVGGLFAGLLIWGASRKLTALQRGAL